MIVQTFIFTIKMIKTNPVQNALLGVAIGDALGVPYEFKSREEMTQYPATDMVGHGTHHQPKGTWSDDSSLTFCLAESLVNGYDLQNIAQRFINWREYAYWTAHNEVFDIGMTTSRAITRLHDIIQRGAITELKEQKLHGDEFDNGNGSLMRIIPLLFHIQGKPITEQFELIWEVSALTHRHIRAAMSCLIYLRLAEKLLVKIPKETAYQEMREEIIAFWDKIAFPQEERIHFQRVIQEDVRGIKQKDLRSGGYVIEVLESSIYFFLTEGNYKDTVLSIINLGHDTDTSAAIAGGLAGIYYGASTIPQYWLASLVRMEDILELGERLFDARRST